MKSLTPLVCVLLIAVASAAQASRPNVLLIVSEDNGPELAVTATPTRELHGSNQLALEGVRFENAFVPYSVCSPSRAAFLTDSIRTRMARLAWPPTNLPCIATTRRTWRH